LDTVKKAFLPVLMIVVTGLGIAEETSFRRVKMPDPKGRQIKAVLTFSDKDKAIKVHPAKGAAVSVPYSQIDKCDYEYTNALMGEKNHWLEIAYHDEDAHKVLLLLMDQKEYLRILDALKAHTGIEAEILGNAKKR